jgi:predicted PhzF superfamily epimerase YddE/YHI9
MTHGVVAPGTARELINWQGMKMGRPSRIHMAIARDAAGTITRVQVGGQAVLVAEGMLSL